MTSNRETPRKNSHRRIKKKEEEEEADVRNSFPELCNKVDSESSPSQLASTFDSRALVCNTFRLVFVVQRHRGGDCVFRLPTYSPLFKLSQSLLAFLFPFHKAPRGRNIKSSVALAAAPFRVFTSTQVPAPTVQSPISHVSHPDV